MSGGHTDGHTQAPLPPTWGQTQAVGCPGARRVESEDRELDQTLLQALESLARVAVGYNWGSKVREHSYARPVGRPQVLSQWHVTSAHRLLTSFGQQLLFAGLP